MTKNIDTQNGIAAETLVESKVVGKGRLGRKSGIPQVEMRIVMPIGVRNRPARGKGEEIDDVHDGTVIQLPIGITVTRE